MEEQAFVPQENEAVEVAEPTAAKEENSETAAKVKKKVGGKRENSNNRGTKTHRDSFCTHTGHPLTPAEANFIDLYIQYSNGRQAILEAYPNTSPKSAAQIAQNKLNKNYIAEEIIYRLEQRKSAAIAEADEIMQYFTSVMRGEIKEQFGLDAPLSERTKAAQELAKRKIDIPNRLAGNEQPEVRIVLDWSR